MASSINASTAGAGGVITTADNSGVLQVQTAGTTALTISAAQAATFVGALSAASASFTAALPVASGGTGVTTSTGTGSTVLSASPTFTGTPLSTTAASGTNTTQIATTAFAYGTFGIGGNGYVKLSNGLIIQWGTNVGTSPITITLPITYPNTLFATPIVTNGDINASSAICGASSYSNSQIILGTNSGGAFRYSWITFGY